MKRLLPMLVLLLFLTGCAGQSSQIDHAIELRTELLKCDGCKFDAVITADYGDKVHTFTLSCQTDAVGAVTFEVSDPESIAGITGTVTEEGGKLTFDETALVFQLLADGQISPVSAPWLFVRSLRSGYIAASGKDGEYTRIEIDDSYKESALHFDVWLDVSDRPVRAEIIWQGRRIVSLDVRNFMLL